MSIEILKAEYLNLTETEQLEFIAFILSIQAAAAYVLSEDEKSELRRRATEIKGGLPVTKSGKEIEERIMKKYGIRL